MEEHDHNKEPIILTSPARLAKGIIIVGLVLAAGATFLAFFFDDMIANPPPVSRIKQPTTTPPPVTTPTAGTTTIEILSGASAQGNPDYKPDDGQVPLGNKVVWKNDDTVPHTATSGTGPEDTNHGKVFDTSIIMDGDSSKPMELAGVKEGDAISYYCSVHPYMTSKLTITAAEKGGAAGGTGASSGPTLNILQGASAQGSKAYDPAELKVAKGSKVHVVNQDSAPHTATSGTGPEDTNHGKVFDTSIIMDGDSFDLDLASVDAGSYDFYCSVHPYMKGKMVVE